MGVHNLLIKRLISSPRRVAVVDDKRSYAGVELLVAATHVARLIRQTTRSETVGLMLPTSGAFPIAALASWMAGKVVVPLNYLLKPEELQYVVDDCETDTIITVQPMLDFVGEPPKVKNLVKLEDINFKRVPMPRWPARRGPDDLATLLYTSGTSGRPKGVMLTHGNLRSNIQQCLEWVPLTTQHTMLSVLPQFHSFGHTVMTLVAIAGGPKVIYTARFDPRKLVKLFEEQRPTVFVGIPSMYGAMLQVKKATPETFSSLVYTVSGGEPLPDAVADEFHERFRVRINEGFGLTETSPVTNWCRPHEFRRHSVGKPLPGIHERIVHIDTGEDCPPGTEGELRIKGPNVMKGYFKLAEETSAVFDEQGYFRTGDMARLDEDGFLYITGRLKEMIIVGGENVFPREIEEVINRHPKVSASGVVGQVDPVRGELPVVFIELIEDAKNDPPTQAEIVSLCRESLAPYKIPREVRVLDTLPRNPTGKIMRRELKSML